jgi:hypothetical protein
MSTCYQCQAVATGACTHCGKFYCPQHGNKTVGDGFFTREREGLCDACHAELAPMAACSAWLLVIVLLGGLVAFVVAVALSR